jgi:hypothetical protein
LLQCLFRRKSAQAISAQLFKLGYYRTTLLQLNLLFFVNTDSDFYTTNQKIELGWGISGEYYLPHSQKKLITKFAKATKGLFGEKKQEVIETELKDVPQGENQAETDKLNKELNEQKKKLNSSKKEPEAKESIVKTLKNLPNLAIGATYIKIKNMKGGVVILTLSPGIRMSYFDWGCSVITGGTITPLVEAFHAEKLLPFLSIFATVTKSETHVVHKH